jgi:hypothetical protein
MKGINAAVHEGSGLDFTCQWRNVQGKNPESQVFGIKNRIPAPQPLIRTSHFISGKNKRTRS